MRAPGTATKETQLLKFECDVQIHSILIRASEYSCLTLFSFSHKQMDLESERSKLQQQFLSERHQYEQKASELESQIAALQTAWDFDKAAAQHRIVSTETVEWGSQVFTERFYQS